ncbi:hypothetical protein D3C80_1770670 [compost metagenome]
MGINDVLDSVWGDELSADATGKWRSLPNRNCMKTVLVLRGFFRAPAGFSPYALLLVGITFSTRRWATIQTRNAPRHRKGQRHRE